MKRLIIIFSIIFLFCISYANADETGTLTQKINKKGKISELILSWETSNSGNFEHKTREINGLIISFITDPGSPAPDDNYDILLIDSYGLRIDGDSGAGETVSGDGMLADRDTANTEHVSMQIHSGVFWDGVPMPYPSIGGMSLFVFNAGKSKQGKFIIRYLAD